MTREEAKGTFRVTTHRSGGEEWESNNGMELIDKIYDAFESSTCRNCKWYDKGKSWEQCAMFDMDVPTKDFGCNKFERNEK